MINSIIDVVAEPIAEGEEHVIALVIGVEEEIAMLFSDDDLSDDDFEGFRDDGEVWEVNEQWLMASVTPPLMPVVPPPSTYEVGCPSTTVVEGQSFTLPAPGFLVTSSMIEDLNTRMGNLEYGHGQLVKKVIQVSDAEVANGIAIRRLALGFLLYRGRYRLWRPRWFRPWVVPLELMLSKRSRKNTKCVNAVDEELTAAKHKLMLLVVYAAKLPILNPNEFDLWKIRIEQYFVMGNYSLWEVVLNGDSSVPTHIVEGVVQPVSPTTAERKLARKNELKARGRCESEVSS
nr:hypothetical protein [Tanacetum cinerariifolium]